MAGKTCMRDGGEFVFRKDAKSFNTHRATSTKCGELGWQRLHIRRQSSKYSSEYLQYNVALRLWGFPLVCKFSEEFIFICENDIFLTDVTVA